MSVTQGIGTTYKWNAYEVGEITKINGVEVTAETFETTVLSAEGFFRTFMPTMLNAEVVVLEGFFSYVDTTGQAAMYADLVARTERESIITFPAATGTTWTFDGYCTAFKVGDVEPDGAVAFTASVKPSGMPIFATTESTGLTTPFFSVSNSAVVVPTKAGDVYEYVATVLTGVSSVTVTPTATAGVITVNGTVVATGNPSGAITLGAAGSLTDITIVVTETSKAPKTYTITVARAAS